MGVPAAEAQRLNDLALGKARTGRVSLRSFDEGVVETLGAKVVDDNYFLTVEGIDPPPGSPGVPVTWSYPEDVYEKYKIPHILIRRDDISIAMQRWHPGTGQYRVPAPGALPVVIPSLNLAGFDSYEELQQAVPFDLAYTLQIAARHRGGVSGSRNQCNRILDHVLRVYPPYCRVLLKDSAGGVRSYEAFMEGISPLDEHADVAERFVGFALTLRVEAELDLGEPEVHKAVTRTATVRSRFL